MKQPVNPIYMQKQELFHMKAIVTETGTSEFNKKRYNWLQTDETIFHPKGGGQLSDAGTINGLPVDYVHKETPDKNRIDQFEILHCFSEDSPFNFKEGDEVELIIDAALRQLYSRMHSAGHLLADTIQEIFTIFVPYHGNHDPENGYVKFKVPSETSVNKEEIIEKALPILNRKISEDLPVKITTIPTGLRAILIGKSVMPCGGTHVKCLREIGNIIIKDISHNKKENTLTIKYGIS